jgi:hypothetical protein
VQGPAGTLESRDAALFGADVDPEDLRDLVEVGGAGHRAASGLDVALDQLARECGAARLPTGAAVVAGEKLLHDLESGIFLDSQEAVGEREHGREEEAEAGHHGDGDGDLLHASPASRFS